MTRKARLAIIISIVVVVLIIIVAITPEIVRYADQNRAVAYVNGEKITKKDFSINYKSQISYYGLDQAYLNQKVGEKTYADEIKKNVLEGLIIRQIELQQAKKRNIALTKSEKSAIDTQISQYKNDTQNGANFKLYLQTIGASEQDYKNEVYKSQIVSKLFDEITKSQTVSSSDVENYYDSHKSDYVQVKASHILFKVSSSKDDAAKKKQAEDVLKMIKDGQSFENLAQKYSEDDSTKSKGGDLGYFKKGEMVKEFEDTAFSLTPGEISNVIKTQYGYHIIKVYDKKQLSFNDVKDEIKSTLENDKKQKYFEAQVEKWRKEAKIKTYENVIKGL